MGGVWQCLAGWRQLGAVRAWPVRAGGTTPDRSALRRVWRCQVSC